jgi:dolichol kinase
MALMARKQKAKFVIALALTTLLEATSAQNDNVTLPIYLWVLLSLLEV